MCPSAECKGHDDLKIWSRNSDCSSAPVVLTQAAFISSHPREGNGDAGCKQSLERRHLEMCNELAGLVCTGSKRADAILCSLTWHQEASHLGTRDDEGHVPFYTWSLGLSEAVSAAGPCTPQ